MMCSKRWCALRDDVLSQMMFFQRWCSLRDVLSKMMFSRRMRWCALGGDVPLGLQCLPKTSLLKTQIWKWAFLKDSFKRLVFQDNYFKNSIDMILWTKFSVLEDFFQAIIFRWFFLLLLWDPLRSILRETILFENGVSTTCEGVQLPHFFTFYISSHEYFYDLFKVACVGEGVRAPRLLQFPSGASNPLTAN